MMMRGLGGVNEDMIETPPVITATVRLQSCNASPTTTGLTSYVTYNLAVSNTTKSPHNNKQHHSCINIE